MKRQCRSFVLAVMAILAVHWSISSAETFVGLSGDFFTNETECGVGMAASEELEMESEASRRILAENKYISYVALKGDTVPCSRRGASYYNCQRGAQANPYSRGCSYITRCRRE